MFVSKAVGTGISVLSRCSLQGEKELSVNAPNYIQVEHWQVSSDYSKVNLKSI